MKTCSVPATRKHLILALKHRQKENRLARIIVLCLFLSVGALSCEEPQADGTGRLVGIVTDSQDARIVQRGLKLLIHGNGWTRETLVNELGEFSIAVPQGRYEIMFQAYPFYPYRRAEISIDSGETVRLDLKPRLRILAWLNVVGADEVIKAPAPHYEDISISRGLRALVEYESRRRINAGVEYKNAAFTYQEWTISASKLLITKQGLIMQEGGRIERGVEVQSGGADRQEISFAHLTARRAEPEPSQLSR